MCHYHYQAFGILSIYLTSFEHLALNHVYVSHLSKTFLNRDQGNKLHLYLLLNHSSFIQAEELPIEASCKMCCTSDRYSPGSRCHFIRLRSRIV